MKMRVCQYYVKTDNDGRPRGSTGAVDKTFDRAARAVVTLLVQGDRRGGQRDLLHVRPRQVVSPALVKEGGARRERGRFLSYRAFVLAQTRSIRARAVVQSVSGTTGCGVEIDWHHGARTATERTHGGGSVKHGGKLFYPPERWLVACGWLFFPRSRVASLAHLEL